MSVVPYPIALVPQAIEPVFIANTKANRSIFNRAVTTLERRGAHHGWRLSYRNLSAANAARIETALKSLRGMANRCYIPMYGVTRRGSGFGSELFTNGTFASGTTGWTADVGSIAASDFMLRLNVLSTASSQGFRQAQTLSQYTPYCLRSVVHDGLGTSGLSVGRFLGDGTLSANDYATSRGLGALQLTSGVTPSSASQYPAVIASASGYTAGSYLECSLASLARCALVDNGPNAITFSDQFDNGAWTPTRATVIANGVAAPDGTTTADVLSEDGTAASDHFISHSNVTVSSAALDYSYGVCLQQVNRTWAALALVETTGVTSLTCYFNLTTGAVGTASAGANWSNPRGFSIPLGNNWHYCVVVGRKTNAATALQPRVYLAEADGDVTFSGLTQQSIVMWRSTLAQSSVPTRPIQTTTTATSGSSQTGGALHLKGLPVSTSGILVAGDPVQIMQPNGSQIVTAAAPLNSDAAGLGYFEFNGQLFESPADNAPVIDVTPLARCLLDQDSVSFPKRPGVFTDVDFTLVEDIQRA